MMMDIYKNIPIVKGISFMSMIPLPMFTLALVILWPGSGVLMMTDDGNKAKYILKYTYCQGF